MTGSLTSVDERKPGLIGSHWNVSVTLETNLGVDWSRVKSVRNSSTFKSVNGLGWFIFFRMSLCELEKVVYVLF